MKTIGRKIIDGGARLLTAAIVMASVLVAPSAFAQDDAAGLSDGVHADEIWMPRGTLGLAYQF